MSDPLSAQRVSQWQGCKVPPAGWVCTREPGHDGPCAAYPVVSASKARSLEDEIERLRGAIREHRRARGRFAVWKGDRKLWSVLGDGDA